MSSIGASLARWCLFLQAGISYYKGKAPEDLGFFPQVFRSFAHYL